MIKNTYKYTSKYLAAIIVSCFVETADWNKSFWRNGVKIRTFKDQ